MHRHLPSILIAAGAVVLSYVGFQYGNMYVQQRRLAREWRVEQDQFGVKDQAGIKSIAADGLTRIFAPSIGLDAIVVEGADRRALALGPGHMMNTAWPGQTGNAVITGHRDTFFRHLYELNKGDVVTVQRNGKSFTYEVTDKRVVDANDMSVVQPTRDAELTLITCYPTYYVGPAPERLIVFSRLKDAAPQSMAENAVPVSRKSNKAALKRMSKTQ
jgi:sortase A